MLAFIMAHAAIQEAVLLKGSLFFGEIIPNALRGDSSFFANLFMFSFAYGHIFFAIIFTICALNSKSEGLPLCLTFVAAGLGCFLHGYFMAFCLHNPSEEARKFMTIYGVLSLAVVIVLFLIECVYFTRAKKESVSA